MPVNFSEIGSTGLLQYSGYVREDFLRELMPPRWQRNVKSMLLDPIVSAAFFAVEMLSRQVTWDIQAASEDKADQEIADFVKGCLFDDMSHPWSETVAEMHSYLPWGFSAHELVYKRRNGENRDPSKNSKYNDGKIGWRKWPIRSQDSLDRWQLDDAGGIQGMYQRVETGPREVLIPIEKMLLFRTTAHKNNPEGKGICKAIFRPFYFKQKIETIEAIGIERDLAGLPVLMIPADYINAAATETDKVAVREYCKNVVTRIKNDEQAGLLLPSNRDEHGNAEFEFKLMSTGGSRAFDTDKVIRRKNLEILITFLADFLLLGHEKVGSFALSSDKTNLFAVALGAFLDSDCEVINRHAIPRLLRINGMPAVNPPKLTHGDIESVDLVELGDFISKLSGAGIKLTPEITGYLLEQAGMPIPEDEEELAAMTQGATPELSDDLPLIANEPEQVEKQKMRKSWIRLAPKNAKGLYLKKRKKK